MEYESAMEVRYGTRKELDKIEEDRRKRIKEKMETKYPGCIVSWIEEEIQPK